jgi:hypothetical protein
MDEELLVAEQIASLLRGPHGVVWDLVKTSTPARPAGAPTLVGQRQGWEQAETLLRPHGDSVPIRDNRGTW